MEARVYIPRSLPLSRSWRLEAGRIAASPVAFVSDRAFIAACTMGALTAELACWLVLG
ncbi:MULTISPECIES: hypothetical protein [Methylobacterium]|uniref:hypothetical protein n=1 Tax=Methylobacterium TaxID=407 RepID=UPI001404AC2F|nr:MULTISPECIES: hypothetical protein [Methylobacterium]MDR7038064.1 hypothetical protein [Methylobacterium sp. BE186]